MKPIHFLSGLPRSGSTVLAGILNQHPSVHASSTSSLLEMLIGTLKAWVDSLPAKAAIDQKESEKEIQRILRTICGEKYSQIDKPIILDKCRSWASSMNISTMTQILGAPPKIIATVRNIPDCVASMVRVSKPTDLDEFLRTSALVRHIKESYQNLESGYRLAPESILFVEYDDLVDNPQEQLDRVHDFLELPAHTYDFNAIDGTNLKERDEEAWNVKGLHDVKPVLARQHNELPEDVLKHRFTGYQQPRFWRGEIQGDAPIHKLDRQLSAGLMGDFDEGERIANELAVEEPWNNRAAFNRGWYELHKGNLQKGSELLHRGRLESLFGNPIPRTPSPLWDGVSKGTVILNLEGGLGDQIHGARFAKDIAAKGCKVIIACSGELALLFRDIEGVIAVIQYEAIFGVVHDFWVPSMSATMPLNLSYSDVSGKAYIHRPAALSKRMKIGLRWQGNPAFEHEQHRFFPAKQFFDSFDGVDADFISLQRDKGVEHRPEWVKEVPLDTWEDTASAIASCDLVVSSCTSIAHLAGAMGVPTYNIVPILPYYLWAPPGESTVWYDSMTLIRQKQFGDWSAPFEDIGTRLRLRKVA